MKKQVITFSIIALTGVLCFTACKKKSDPAPASTSSSTTGGSTTGGSSSSASTPPTASDADGVMVALRLNTASVISVPGFGNVTTFIKLDGGIAQFPTTTGGNTYQDAGTVTLNTTTLTKQSNNQYQKIQQPNQANFGLSSSVSWTVAGTSSVPAISGVYAYQLPTYDTTYFGNLLPSNTLTKSSGLTVYISSYVSHTTSSDSVICLITGGGSTSVKKTVSVNASTVSFTASELSGLSNTTNGQFQITPYSIYSNTYSGKKYYFVSEQAYVKTGVTIN